MCSGTAAPQNPDVGYMQMMNKDRRGQDDLPGRRSQLLLEAGLWSLKPKARFKNFLIFAGGTAARDNPGIGVDDNVRIAFDLEPDVIYC